MTSGIESKCAQQPQDRWQSMRPAAHFLVIFQCAMQIPQFLFENRCRAVNSLSVRSSIGFETSARYTLGNTISSSSSSINYKSFIKSIAGQQPQEKQEPTALPTITNRFCRHLALLTQMLRYSDKTTACLPITIPVILYCCS